MINKILAGAGLGIAAIGWFGRDQIITRLPAKGLDFTMTRNDVRLALRAQAAVYGFDPDWFDAIAKIEPTTPWQLDAFNGSDPQGGAWGPMQILRSNIERLGYTVDGVTSDPNIAGQCAGELMTEGKPATFEEACVWWNAGRKGGLAGIPESRPDVLEKENKYLTKALAALSWVQGNPPT